MGHKLLIVDDDSRLLESVGTLLKVEGYVVHRATRVEEALRCAQAERPDAVIIDHHLPDGNAINFLSTLRGRGDKTPVVVLTGNATYDLAVAAIKAGADNFITKPVHGEALLVMIERVLQHRREERKHKAAARSGATARFDPFIGTSRAILQLSELAHAVLHSQASVLILGETGTGKGVLARWLHDHGARADAAYVDLNCAGLSKDLAESELFGHRRGAFTGASSDKGGLLELAHDGTLFLDEIGDLDLTVQPKLLKVLEDKVYRRLGEVQTREADVRLISATHRDLVQMTAQASFRNDLLFRINTIMFELPALRTRKEDIIPIAENILERIASEQGKTGVQLSGPVREALMDYAWPGNVRELRNTLERALIFCRGEELQLEAVRLGPSKVAQLAQSVQKATPADTNAASESLEDVERRHILQAMKEAGGKVDTAAAALGIARSSLYAKLKRYGVSAR